MDNRTKRPLSIALMTVISLSIFVAVAPVVAENTPDTEAFCGTAMYDEEEHLKSKVTDIETEGFGTMFEGMAS